MWIANFLAKPEKLLLHFNQKQTSLTVLARRKNADHSEMFYKDNGLMVVWFIY